MHLNHEELILKSLRGGLTSGEKEALDAWVNDSAENRATFEAIKEVWELTNSGPSAKTDYQTVDEWEKFEAAIGEDHKAKLPEGLRSASTWMKIAAAISFVVVSSFVLYLLISTSADTVITSDSETRMIELPDGSTIWLNEGGRINYRDNFTGNRMIELSGEAFFAIKKIPTKPFVIRTKQALVEVLGTSFNVKADPEKEEAEVFVVTGSVRFSAVGSTGRVSLIPGEIGVLDRKNNLVVRRAEEGENVLAWKEKRLTFRKTPLKNVIAALENYFSITIDVSDPKLLECRFTSSFSKPALEEVIEALAVSLNLDIVHENDRYTIHGKGC